MTDFYLEQVCGDTYLRDGRQVALEQRAGDAQGGGWRGRHDHRAQHRARPDPVRRLRVVDEAGDRVVVRGAPQSNRYAVSLAWTALTPGTTADAIFAINTARRLGRLPRGRGAVRRARRRTSSMPTPTATSATRRPAASRSAARRRPAPSRLLARTGLGQPVGLEGLRALRRPALTPSTPPRASSSRPTRR